MNYSFETLNCGLHDNIMVVSLNRPSALNALNAQVFQDLKSVFLQMEKDDQVRVAIITGSGNKAFAAGTDIIEMSKCTLIEAREFCLQVNSCQQTIANFTKPTIAAINGFAYGGGLEIALCCDFRIASENARMGQLEINVGIIPGGGGSQRLSRLIGLGRAKEMVYCGMIIDAPRAYEIGLVNAVVPLEQLLGEAIKRAQVMCEKSSIILKFAKAVMDSGIDMDLNTALKTEIEIFAECFGTQDGIEGLTAFVEKRKPNFIGK